MKLVALIALVLTTSISFAQLSSIEMSPKLNNELNAKIAQLRSEINTRRQASLRSSVQASCSSSSLLGNAGYASLDSLRSKCKDSINNALAEGVEESHISQILAQ
jgi:hypothetical protein